MNILNMVVSNSNALLFGVQFKSLFHLKLEPCKSQKAACDPKKYDIYYYVKLLRTEYRGYIVANYNIIQSDVTLMSQITTFSNQMLHYCCKLQHYPIRC